MKRSFALLAALLPALAAFGQTPAIPLSPEESKIAYREMLCGKGLPPTSTEFPTVGCFAVPSGGKARGLFDGHQFEAAVDASGEARCRLDGSAAECNGCIGPQVDECPIRLLVVARNADKSVSFSVQRKTGENRYVYRIDSWNLYLQQRQIRQEVEAAEAQAETRQQAGPAGVQTAPQTAAPGVPVMPPIPPPPLRPTLPPLPPGMVPGSVVATDGPAALGSVGWKVQHLYGAAQFAKLDQLIETLTQPDQLTDDGVPRALGVLQGLKDFLDGWNNWQFDLDKIAEWRKEYPDSYGADLTEAILWRQWGWHARGGGYASTVTPEGWRLFGERLGHAEQVLERCKSRASKSPLWYSLRLSVARDASWDRKRYQALLDEATQRFPWYIPFYLSATNYFSPKWGGTYEDVDQLARRTTAAPLGNDHSLYTRIYWELTNEAPEDFELFRDSKAAWPLMKAGFEGLMKRYPTSKWNLNAYAYFACRANDGPTYGALRARIGQSLMPGAWAANYATEVCDERLLGHT